MFTRLNPTIISAVWFEPTSGPVLNTFTARRLSWLCNTMRSIRGMSSFKGRNSWLVLRSHANSEFILGRRFERTESEDSGSFTFLTSKLCVLSSENKKSDSDTPRAAANQREKKETIQHVATSEDDADHNLTYFQPMGVSAWLHFYLFVSWHMEAHASQRSRVCIVPPCWLVSFH